MPIRFEMNGFLKDRKELSDKEYRDALVEVEIRHGIPVQIREMREARGWSQAQLGERIGKPQNNISRIETTRDGYLSIKTLLDIAAEFDVGLLVRFVPYSDVLRWVDNHTLETVVPKDYASEVASEIEEEIAMNEMAASRLLAESAPNVTKMESHILKMLDGQPRRAPQRIGDLTHGSNRGSESSRGLHVSDGANQPTTPGFRS